MSRQRDSSSSSSSDRSPVDRSSTGRCSSGSGSNSRRKPNSPGYDWAIPLLAVAALWALAIQVALAGLPFASDSLVALEKVRGFQSPLDSFRMAPIYRPIEILWFALIDWAGLDQPWMARLLGLAKHLACGALVFVLARRLGALRLGAALATLLFALAPTTINLGWVMAHSTPGRALWVLAGFLAFLSFERHGKSRAAVGAVLFFALALLNHPGAIQLPAMCLAWVFFLSEGSRGASMLSTLRRIGTPALGGLVLLGALFTFFTLFVLPDRYHGLQSLAGLPANVVRATTVALPGPLRSLAVEGLRGNLGAPGWIGGGALVASVLLLGAWLLVKADRITKFLVVAIAIDLAIPLLTTGYAQRHGYLTFALLAVGVAHWVTAKGRVAIVCGALLGAFWAVDSVRTVGYQRQAGRIIKNTVEACRAAREVFGLDARIFVVDLPSGFGPEEDIPLFNWGFPQALSRAGIPGTFVAYRTTPSNSSTDQILLDAPGIEAMAAEADALLMWFNPATDTVELRRR